ncbi:membrane protein [Colletotrichum tofieldiae]|nr:membrane protein [Colletotrichum tofieldiae]
MTAIDDSSPSTGRDALQKPNPESLRREDASTLPVLPDDEESVTAAESDTTLEQSTSSNGYTYGAAAQPAPPPKPADSSAAPANGATPETAGNAPPPTRALAPDLLRGLLMMFMAMDHNVIGLNSWPHSTGANHTESDSALIDRWNRPIGYAVRTLSHLCAPGFTFLLGMGVVYFGRSRARLGWSPARMARHFAIRAVVLTAVSTAIGFVLSQGQLWFLNMVLVALAVDYLVVGLLWLGIAETEPMLASALDRFALVDDGDESTPLLVRTGHRNPLKGKASARAQSVSWHAHNALLVVLASVTIWWNIWLSPSHGACTASPIASAANGFWRFWFYEVSSPHVMSGFPPLAWLSFAILGLLYGRVVLARPLSPTTLASGNVAAGHLFSVLFVLTRVLRANPYLVSAASFFYVVKYPPDVAFFAYTLSATFFLLAILGMVPPRFATKWLKVLLAFGTSALFFYLMHLLVLFGLSMLVTLRLFGRENGVPPPMEGRPAVGVDSVLIWWANWALVMAIMYPLCRWYSAFKKTRALGWGYGCTLTDFLLVPLCGRPAAAVTAASGAGVFPVRARVLAAGRPAPSELAAVPAFADGAAGAAPRVVLGSFFTLVVVGRVGSERVWLSTLRAVRRARPVAGVGGVVCAVAAPLAVLALVLEAGARCVRAVFAGEGAGAGAGAGGGAIGSADSPDSVGSDSRYSVSIVGSSSGGSWSVSRRAAVHSWTLFRLASSSSSTLSLASLSATLSFVHEDFMICRCASDCLSHLQKRSFDLCHFRSSDSRTSSASSISSAGGGSSIRTFGESCSLSSSAVTARPASKYLPAAEMAISSAASSETDVAVRAEIATYALPPVLRGGQRARQRLDGGVGVLELLHLPLHERQRRLAQLARPLEGRIGLELVALGVIALRDGAPGILEVDVLAAVATVAADIGVHRTTP